MKDKLHNLFNWTINITFGLILVCLVIGICIGALQLVGGLFQLMRFDGVTGKYIDMISDVLTLYVLIELSRSLIEFFDSHRLRLSLIIDAAIVFIVREILIGLFKHQLKPEMIYALSALILVLGIVRIGSFLTSKNSPRLKVPQHPKSDDPGTLPRPPPS